MTNSFHNGNSSNTFPAPLRPDANSSMGRERPGNASPCLGLLCGSDSTQRTASGFVCYTSGLQRVDALTRHSIRPWADTSGPPRVIVNLAWVGPVVGI